MQIDIIFKIATIGILITVITQILKKSDRDDIATLVSLVGFIIVLGIVITMISQLFETIKNIFKDIEFEHNNHDEFSDKAIKNKIHELVLLLIRNEL